MSVECALSIDYYSTAIIKPDAFRDFLTPMIIDDLRNEGLSVVFRKELILRKEEAEQLYADHLMTESGRQRFSFAVSSFLLKDKFGCRYPSMFLVLRSNDPHALDITKKAKGQADKSGIRAKYRMFFWYELEQMGIEGADLQTRLSQNRLHVPDDCERMKEMLRLFVNGDDVDMIQEVDRTLAEILDSIKNPIVGKVRLRNN